MVLRISLAEVKDMEYLFILTFIQSPVDSVIQLVNQNDPIFSNQIISIFWPLIIFVDHRAMIFLAQRFMELPAELASLTKELLLCLTFEGRSWMLLMLLEHSHLKI